MLEYYQTMHIDKNEGIVMCGIVFESITANKIAFTLRYPFIPRSSRNDFSRQTWHTAHVMPDISTSGPREEHSKDGGLPGYAREAFLGVQHVLTMAAASATITMDHNRFNNMLLEQKMQLKMARFPYPPFTQDYFTTALSFFFPAIIMFSFIYPSVNITKNIVIEKERRQKESMKMMGLSECSHWISHFVKSIIWIVPSLLIITVFMFVHFKGDIAILNYSNPLLLFVFFFSYQVCNTCLCFAISTLFSKANLAGIATGVIFFFSFIPFFSAVAQYRLDNLLLL